VPSCLQVCAVSVILCFPSAIGQSQQSVKPSESVWFGASEGHQAGKLEIEPLGKFVGHEILPVQSGCDPTVAEYKKFVSAYLQVGQTYSATFGGAPAGILGLRGSDPDCGSDTVEYDGIAHIHGLVMARD
jgi:hypothetical protein